MFAADCLWIRTVNWTINTFKHLNRCLFRGYVIFIYTKEIKYRQKTNSTTSDPAALWTVLLFRIIFYICTYAFECILQYIMWTDTKQKKKLRNKKRKRQRQREKNDDKTDSCYITTKQTRDRHFGWQLNQK